MALLVLFVSMGMLAFTQNTSYNANTIPIGGTGSNAFGFEALKVNAGNINTTLGYRALCSNTVGTNNTAAGSGALLSNNTGSNNTAIGLNALLYNTTDNQNTAMGVQAPAKPEVLKCILAMMRIKHCSMAIFPAVNC